MEPSDEQKQQILRALLGHLGGMPEHIKKPPKEPLGEFPIPPEHIERVLELACVDGLLEQRKLTNDLWRFIYSIMPGTRDYLCSLSTSNSTRPVVVLREYAPGSYVQVGVRDVIERHVVPAENYKELEALTQADDSNSTALTRYRLWRRLEQLLPAVEAAPDIRWRLHISVDEVIVFRSSEPTPEETPASEDADD